MMAAYIQKFIRAEIHHHKAVILNEADTVSSRYKLARVAAVA